MGGEDDADLTAAEHVLGLLEGEARERAAARLRADPSFQADVEDWERRLAPLADAVAPVSPSEQLWERIAETIGPQSNVVALSHRARPWERVGLWRATTVVSMAAAAACLALVILRPASGPPSATGPVLVATLAEANGKALFVATLDRSRRAMTVVPVSAPADRSPELWIIPAGGKPRPVGMLNAVQARLIPASAAVLSVANTRAVLAVSLEPAGGSPTGAPTGPVIATGAFKAL